MNIYSLNPEASSEQTSVLLGRRERHRLLRRADIIRAAEHVFAQKGFHKATIQDIAREAQYATGTVYLYFEDKNSLYQAIVEEKINEHLRILKARTAQAKGARAKLEAFICESLKYFEKNKDFFRIFIQEETNLSFKSKLSKSAYNRTGFLNGLIKEAQSEELIRDDVQIIQIKDLLVSVLTSLAFNWWQEETRKEKDLKGMSAIIMDLFLNGAKKR